MSLDQQIPRASILWLIAAQLAVILPHIQRMPWWVIVIWLLCVLWRLAMYRGQAHYPGKVLRMFVVVLASIGVVVSFGSLGGLDISVALLVVAFCLKLIEVRQRRDMFIIFFLAFFVIATAFLFSQSLGLALYQSAAAALVLTGMVVTQNTTRHVAPAKALSITAKLGIQSLPIMLVFFLVFPRIAPLWSVASQEGASSTGMSDTMAPGDVAKLNRSDKLAFSVKFEKRIPSREQLYWRAMSLSEFDGRTWRRGEPQQAGVNELLVGDGIRYQQLISPTSNSWLYTIPVAVPIAGQGNGYEINENDDYSLFTDKPIDKTLSLNFISYPDSPRGLWMTGDQLNELTSLPSGFNPRTIALAKSMYAQSGSVQRFVQAIQRKIATEDYYYTLEPPLLGTHSVDEFLFDKRRGYCEHYSSATVVMLRAAGIPSRVVIGYQGGEVNEVSQTLTVRQFDAHAWIEYWLAGEGWLRLDPTASVAPSRISMGMQDSLYSDDSIEVPVFSSLYLRNLPAIKFLRQRAEAINYSWQHLIVNFDADKQSSVLETLLGQVTPLRTALLVLAAMLASGALIVLRLLWQGRIPNEPQYLRDYRQFQRKLAKIGVVPQSGEAASTFARRAALSVPNYSVQIREISELFERIAYAENGNQAALHQQIKQFKPHIPAKK